MRLKALFLGAGAGVILAGPALALTGDEGEGEGGAVEYVRVCDLYGAGFFYIPGTDTCLKIGGYVRFETQFNAPNNGANSRWDFTTGYGVKFDARTQTAYGTLRSYVSLQGDTSDHIVGSDPPISGIDIHKSFIQFAGFTIGANNSIMEPKYGYTIFDDEQPDLITDQIRYSWQLGNGFQGSIGIEDPRKRWGSALPNPYSTPDIVGQVRIDQAWGNMSFSGGATDLGHGLNWGVQLDTTIKLDTLGQGDRLRFALGYAHDGGDWIGGSGIAAGNWTRALVSGKFYVAPNWYVAATASAIDGPGTSYDRWDVSGGLHWTPVTDLCIGGDIGFNSYLGTRVLVEFQREWGGRRDAPPP